MKYQTRTIAALLAVALLNSVTVVSAEQADAEDTSRSAPAWVKKPAAGSARTSVPASMPTEAGRNAGTAYDCLIEPHSVVDVSTREEGVLETLTASRGDIVKKGQAVASLESGLEKLTVDMARARAAMSSEVESKRAALQFHQRQLERVNDLYKQDATSFREKDKADTDVLLARMELRSAEDEHKIAQIERDRAEHLLTRRTIHSPVDGVVVKTLLEPGESVEERPIMTIAEVNPLNVEVILPVEQFGEVAIGSTAEITPQIHGGGVLKAKVVIVDRVIDAASNTFGVRLELPNPDYKIPGGIRCDIRFIR